MEVTQKKRMQCDKLGSSAAEHKRSNQQGKEKKWTKAFKNIRAGRIRSIHCIRKCPPEPIVRSTVLFFSLFRSPVPSHPVELPKRRVTSPVVDGLPGAKTGYEIAGQERTTGRTQNTIIIAHLQERAAFYARRIGKPHRPARFSSSSTEL
ncbi:hypothetical protein ZHAS_00004369 [Anopheles sinensis]|uniref:Uncharacterized protein n=1 Tax=Anopheles sinensis TaxID=74873 RepID=A0A084VGR8_ANOSI|nr:hypothetical protein ZHAS_00004369 [Anopheles sinensis]